jgi:prepilin-type processing-associated H-X9-DG protein
MFAHLRAGEVLQSPVGRQVRDTLRKNNPAALAHLDKLLGTPLAGIDSVTAVWPTSDLLHAATSLALVVNLAKPATKKDVLAALTRGEEDRDGLPDGFYRFLGNDGGTVSLAGDRRIVLFTDERARANLFEHLLQRGPGGLEDSLAAVPGHDLVIGLRPNALLPRPDLSVFVPDVQQLVRPLVDAESVTITADFGDRLRLAITARFPRKADAVTAEQSARAFLLRATEGLKADLARNPGELKPYREALQGVADGLKAARFERQGATVTLTAEAPAAPLLAAAADLSAGGVGTAARVKSADNLKRIALAMHNYHDTYGSFPPAAICDKQGKPLLSWRVAILPFIDRKELYDQFHLDEPWDSPHNKRVAEGGIYQYRQPGAKDEDPDLMTLTHYQVFVGGGAAFEPRKGVTLVEIAGADGTSNTLMVAEAAEPVPWTAPFDLRYDPKQPLPKLGGVYDGGFNAAFCDGSVRFIKKTAKEKALRAAITRNGGETFDPNDL